MNNAIQIEGITKKFGRGRQTFTAVEQLTLTVPAGMVYGFLGPNGAGKTTTIRMLMDLIRPSAGHAQIYGRRVQDPATLKRVGALIEGPAFYGYLTGYENLAVLAHTRQCFDAKRIRALLAQVGLDHAAQKHVSQYSLGMKQRLGLAGALLHDPELLILDEPTNGLDPAGMAEMRALIRQLATEAGKTIFLSSHLLNEVEQLCDRVAIIHHGRIVREGAVPELLGGQTLVVLEVEPLAQATALLADKPWGPAQLVENTLTLQVAREAIPQIIATIAAAGINIYRVSPERQSLEDYFLAVTH